MVYDPQHCQRQLEPRTESKSKRAHFSNPNTFCESDKSARKSSAILIPKGGPIGTQQSTEAIESLTTETHLQTHVTAIACIPQPYRGSQNTTPRKQNRVRIRFLSGTVATAGGAGPKTPEFSYPNVCFRLRVKGPGSAHHQFARTGRSRSTGGLA